MVWDTEVETLNLFLFTISVIWVAFILFVGFDGLPVLKVNFTESPTIKLWSDEVIVITWPDCV